MKLSKSSAGSHRLLQGAAVLALSAASLSGAVAAQYTAQEKANMQMVRDFYAALDAGDAKGNMKEAIVSIAEKYIAPDYKQHMAGAQSGRDNFVKLFQRTPAGAAALRPAPAERAASRPGAGKTVTSWRKAIKSFKLPVAART
jgi:hypothetical protein